MLICYTYVVPHLCTRFWLMCTFHFSFIFTFNLAMLYQDVLVCTRKYQNLLKTCFTCAFLFPCLFSDFNFSCPFNDFSTRKYQNLLKTCVFYLCFFVSLSILWFQLLLSLQWFQRVLSVLQFQHVLFLLWFQHVM